MRFLDFVVLAQGIRIEEEMIEVVKTWLEFLSVKDILMFLGFANFYRRFIRKFSRIVAPLTSMLRTIDNNDLNTQTNQNEKNQDLPDGNAGDASDGRVGGSIKNLSTVAKLAKSKKSKLTKLKKSDLIKTQNFARANSSGMDFLTFEAKKAFIHLWKAFIKASIFKHFDSECQIRIETEALKYAIGRVLSQIILDQHSSSLVIHEDPNSDFLKSEIGQWHLVALFSQKMIYVET